MMKKLEKILMPLAEAIGRNKYLMSIRDGFLVSTPLLIGGSIFLLIANFPIQGWINFLETTVVNSSTGQTLASFISKPAGATFDIMAIFAVIGIAYSFAGKMNTNKIFGAAVAVVSWFLIMPYSISGSVDVAGKAVDVSLSTNVFQIIFEFLQTPLLNLGDTLGAMVVAYIFLHLFWFFGVNGGSVVGAVFNPILQTLSAGNIAGEHHIICQQFQDLFATFGGAGSTLSLVIAMLLFCKSKRITNLGKLSFVPGIFGINEPIVFGLPIVLNPTLLIPFVLVPTVNIVISYFAMAMNLVPICSGINIPWTTPIVISGFLATNWAGALLQVLLLILGIFIYMPFIKIMDKQYLEEETNMQNDEEEEDDISLDDLSFDDL